MLIIMLLNIIIDCSEVYMRIYLPQKGDIHWGHKVELYIIFKGRSTLCIAGIQVNNCFSIFF